MLWSIILSTQYSLTPRCCCCCWWHFYSNQLLLLARTRITRIHHRELAPIFSPVAQQTSYVWYQEKNISKLNYYNGAQLVWVDTCKYLGVYFVRGRYFRCTFEDVKKNFFSSFNAVYSKIGRFASEEVVVNLLDTKCIAPMLYGIEACPVTLRHKHSLDFTVTRVFMKLLCAKNNDIVLECQNFFGFLPVSQRIAISYFAFSRTFNLFWKFIV